ncbi:Protein Gp5, N-terminal OB-fold domain containing protein [uncultured Caudovirales phage]|uniref:Protein Gp5, N-terminal OB-fold domain containing protein n=1 Tax=uncultured Caudovirales phage TaxID=2100421 RepID=A0A6J5L3P9_9CAUD|nr:Protein Gp5, N-terminal OB-fold domain containing protein [uncultured Caudovirales phage]
MYYTGVCEDRMDPLMLGRCKVRIIGLHTENKTDLPTDDLPWAYPLQPITSAGISGIGHAPVGPVEGSWVVVIFADEDKQQPMMIGTIGGIPQEKNGINGGNGQYGTQELVTGIGTSTVTGPIKNDTTPPAPLTESSRLIGPLANLIAKAESGNKGYNAFNRGTANGKIIPAGGNMILTDMQISEIMTLQALPPGNPQRLFAVGRYQCIPDTLKEAVKSLNIDITRKFNEVTQDLICQEYLLAKKRPALVKYYKSSDKADQTLLMKAGQCLAAEFASIEDPYFLGYPYGGPNGRYYRSGNKAHTMWESQIKPTLLAEWDFRNGAKPSVTSQLGEPTIENPATPSTKGAADNVLTSLLKVIAEATNIPALGELLPDGTVSNGIKDSNFGGDGFKDPTGTYPLYVKEPDTNRLAINNNIESTIIMQKEAALDTGVRIANGGTWDQSPPPYNAQYPFNHVYQSESGHIMEFDDTHGSERIHLYHKAGTYTEIDANGSKVNRIVGDNFEIMERNGFVHVKGSLNVTVDGAYNVRVDNTLNLEVSGNALINIFNDAEINVSGNANLSVGEEFNIRASYINIEAENEINLKAGTNINTHADGDYNLKSTNINTYSTANTNNKVDGTLTSKIEGTTSIGCTNKINISGANLDISVDGAFNTDYTSSALGSGDTNVPSINVTSSQIIEAGISNLLPPGDIRETSPLPTLPELSVATRGAEVGFDDPDSGDFTEYNVSRINSNIVSQADVAADKIVVDSAAPIANSSSVPINATCDLIYNMNPQDFNPNMKLSEYFTLGDLTKGGIRIPRISYPVKGKHDTVARIYSPQEIVCNLKGLCTNVLDPIAKKYGRNSFIITSGFRRPIVGNIPGDMGMHAEGGDHNRGCAADLQFKGGSAKMFEIAKELVTLLPAWNQIILEYDGKSTWIHVAFYYTGNKGDYFTMNHNEKYGGTYPKGGFILI